MHLPLGYVKRPSGEIVKDPDEQAQTVVELLFEQFQRRGTIKGVLCYLVEHDLKLPIRVASGPDKGELCWSRPNRMTLQNVFNNPTYAGAYVYGRRPIDPRAKRPGRPATGRKVAHVGEWAVCLRDRLPAYISFEQEVPGNGRWTCTVKDQDNNDQTYFAVETRLAQQGWLLLYGYGLQQCVPPSPVAHP